MLRAPSKADLIGAEKTFEEEDSLITGSMAEDSGKSGEQGQ